MARIVRHNGNLRALVSQSESVFFSKLLMYLADAGVVHSVIGNHRYQCIKNNDFNCLQLQVNKIGHFHAFRGKKPDIIINMEERKNGRPDIGI